jgi:hypothetical protein
MWPYAEVSEFLGHGLLNILKSRSLQSGSDTPFSGLLVCFFGIGRLSGRSLSSDAREPASALYTGVWRRRARRAILCSSVGGFRTKGWFLAV